MSTLADELLQDFEDSGSEDESAPNYGFIQDEATTSTNGLLRKTKNQDQDGGMELDGDEEAVGDEDEQMMDGDTNGNALDVADDEEAMKAKVEKMELGAVEDVRSVAGLMKTLEPVLEVSLPTNFDPF